MTEPSAPRCPVCAARFRETSQCSRCGADLTPLMILAVQASLARRAAIQALSAGDFSAAGLRASQAQRLCATRSGRRLEDLTAWLVSHRPLGGRGAGGKPAGLRELRLTAFLDVP